MTVARRPARSRTGVLVGILLATAFVLVPGASATADDALTWSPTSVTTSYGQFWSATLTTSTLDFCLGGCSVKVSYTGTTSGSFTTDMQPDPNPPYGGNAQIFATQPSPPLGAGNYQFSATATQTGDASASETTSSPLAMKISPAVLTTNLLIQTDPQNSRNAVISASLAGAYIDEINNGDDFWKVPAGTWHVTVKDATGATAFTKDTATAAGFTSFVNLYWAGVPAGGTFSGSATFAPSGAAAANFAITPAASAAFTTPAKPTATPSPGPTDAPAPAQLTGAAIPLWLLILLGVLGLAALVLLIVAIVRRPNPAGAHSVEGGAPDPAGDDEAEAP